MHERTRRAVARLLFVLCCAIPTLMMTIVVLATFTPWFANYRRHRLEQSLSLRTGLAVEIDNVEYPAPATVRLTGVRLLEPETKAEVAKVRIVTWVMSDEKTAFTLSQPELQSAMLPYAWRTIHDRFFCQPDLTDLPIRMAANDVTIHSRSGSMSLPDVDTWLRPVSSGITGVNQIVPADRGDVANVHIEVERDRSGPKPETKCTLMTGDIPLHCAALADCFPLLKKLGPDATFTGTARWKLQSDSWSLDLGASRFQQVDLDDWSVGMKHRVTGMATVELQRCQIQPGDALDVSGSLISQSGFVSHSLMLALKQELQFEINPALQSDAREIAYDNLALRFDFFGAGMTLSGICNRQPGHERLPQSIVFSDDGVPLLASGPGQQTWVGLAKSLWPEPAEALPVSTQTAWLFGLLPAPQPTATSLEEASQMAPRITSAGEYQATPTISQPR